MCSFLNRIITIGFLLLCLNNGYSQDIMVYEKKEEQVRKYFQKEAGKKKNIGRYKFFESRIKDTLIIKVEGRYSSISKFLFSKSTGYCIYQNTELGCDSCAVFFYDYIMRWSGYEWREVGKNKYISKPLYQTGLTVKDKGEFCKEYTFKFLDVNRDEYEKRYFNLKPYKRIHKKKESRN